DGLAVLRGVEDKTLEDKLYCVVGFTDLGAAVPRKAVYDPAADKTFPTGMAISANRNPNWTEGLDALHFGIHRPHKKDPKAAEETGKDDAPKVAGKKKGQPGKPTETGDAAPDKVNLVIWHWQDDRLQSQQQVEAGRDKTFSFLCAYRVKEHRFLRLANETL